MAPGSHSKSENLAAPERRALTSQTPARTLGEAAGKIVGRSGQIDTMSQCRRKFRQPRARNEDEIAGGDLACVVAIPAVVATIRLHPAPIAVDGIEFADGSANPGVRRFKYDAAIGQHFVGKYVPGGIRDPVGLASR